MFEKIFLKGRAWFTASIQAAFAAVMIGAVNEAAGQPANDNFGAAITIPSVKFGTVSSTNNLAGLELGEPTLVNYTQGLGGVASSVWYKWTAPASGVVAFDTFGSDFDTVLAVYTIADTLPNLVTVNDDYIPGIVPQSYVSFAVTAGTQYFISVNGSAAPLPGYASTGNFTLEWNETVPAIPSGTFQFTSAHYTVSDLDGNGAYDTAMDAVTPWYGARVTVTRSAGSSGRVIVPYTYTPLANQLITAGGGQLVFDDFQMSADIAVPVSDVTGFVNANQVTTNYTYYFFTNSLNVQIATLLSNATIIPVNGGNVRIDGYNNAALNSDIVALADMISTNISGYVTNLLQLATPGQIGVALQTPVLDPLESSDLQPPALGANNVSVVKVLSHAGGVSVNDQAYSNTNVNFYIERSTFRVQRSAGKATVYVYSSRAPSLSETFTVRYALDHDVIPAYTATSIPTSFDGANSHNFELQADSDFANPGVDFTDVSGGTLTWQPGDGKPQAITIPILDNTNAVFNEDLIVRLYKPLDNGVLQALSQDNSATVTILYDKQPAGAVDRTWNRDGQPNSNPPYLQYPGAQGGVSDSGNGNGGMVYAVLEQPDGKAVFAGSFISYNSTPYNRIVRVLANGYPDTSFLAAPNSGANGAINSMALQSDGKIIIAGEFTSFNGTSRYHIARLNTDGSLDATFNPGLGADGKIWAVALQANGKIVIGGEFQNYNGNICQYLARLNSDGTQDTTFNANNSLNGNVYAVALNSATSGAIISINRAPNGTDLEDDNIVDLGSAVAGTLNISYDMLSVPDDLRVYYGGTNGVRIFDTGLVSGTGNIVLNFGPTNRLTTNVVTIVMNQGNGVPGTLWSYTASVTASTLVTSNRVYVAGAFSSVAGARRGGLARINGDGTLDSSFDPGIGTYNPDTGNTDPINALAVQSDGKVLAGGAFSYVDMLPINGLTRFNADGTLDTTFSTMGTNNGTYNPLTGVADQVKALILETNGSIYIGGDFTKINQTRRMGIARLYSDGSVDTTFMDTAYNQFAGLINHYHNPDAVNIADYPQGNHRNSVMAIALEPGTGNVMIGGNFLRAGGGSYLHADANPPKVSDGVYPEDQADVHGIIANGRMDIHPRSNVARLVGGSTVGPGNIGFNYNSYTVDKDGGTLDVQLVRTNGNLGSASVVFYSPPGVVGQQGVAIENTDYFIGNFQPTWTINAAAWMLSTGNQGLSASLGFGGAADQILTIVNHTNLSGNLNANMALTQPSSTFRLGGEYIPLGVALGGNMKSPLTIIDDNFPAGTFSFSSPNYTVNENLSSAAITVTRTNGTRGAVQINYATFNGTAKSPTNYTLTYGVLSFADGEISKSFSVAIIPGTLSGQDKTINLALYGITGGGSPGLTNAVLTIVNNNYVNGHVDFAFATNGVNETDGTAAVAVNRLGGSSGTVVVNYTVTNGTAQSPNNFLATTGTLTWNNGDVATKYIYVPIYHDGIYSSNLAVSLKLVTATLNNTPAPNVLGYSTVTNATLIITNVDFPGKVEFTSGTYSVKKSAGFALIPVIRTGGIAGTVTVGFATANSNALSGVDYSATNGTLTFTNGVVSQYFQVPILAGSVSGPVALNLALSNGTGLTGSPSNAVLNIIDTSTVNESPGTVDVTYNPNSGCNGNIYSLVLQTNNQLLVGGDFTMVNGVPRQRLARLNADGSLDATFSLPTSTMGANDQVRAMAVQTDGRIVVGGYFTVVNNVVMNRIARLNYDGSLDSLFNTGSGADSPVNAVAETFVNGARKIVVGGAFNQLNGVVVNGIGRLNDDGTTDATFNAGGLGANGTVYAVAVQSTDGKIVIGGDFTQINGLTANHIARLNVNGSLDMTFTNAGASDSVRALAIQLDGQILAGGLFTSFYNNTNFNHIARLNSTDGSADASFNPGQGANGAVLSIALQSDTRIVLGGSFTLFSGVTRNGITRLNPDGSVDPLINFGSGADSFVASVVVQNTTIPGYPAANVPDEKMILGGGFTHYNGVPEPYLARIYGGSLSGSGTFSFSAPTYSVNENGTNVVITINRIGGTSGTNADGSGNVLVNFATTNGGTAVSPINYTPVVTNLTFPVGEVQKVVTIPVRDDLVITNDLTVNLALTPLTTHTYGDQPTAVLTIVNVDSAINFTTPTYLVTKYAGNVPAGSARIYVSRIGAAYGTSTVVFNTTTNGNATVNTDYLVQTNILVTFAPGVSNQTVLIPIINGVSDGTRTVSMQLSQVTQSVLGSTSNAVLSILDGTLLPGVFALAATNYVVSEGGGVGYTNAVVTVLRTNGSSGIVGVSYYTADGTAAGSALGGGGKYVITAGILTFADGEMSKTITIPVANTATVEPTETFSISLTNATGGAGLLAPTNGTITILNTNTGFAFTVSTNSVLETAGMVYVTVSRYNNLSGGVSVNYATTNGTAVSGVNYTATSGTLNFSNNQSLYTIPMPILYDTNVTGDLQFTMGLLSPSGGAQIGIPSMTTIIIKDVDTGLSFTTNATTVMKNGTNVVLTVRCSNTNAEPVSVNFATSNGSAVAGVDYTATNGVLTFSNGVATQTITVPILKNSGLNGSHLFTVGLFNPTGTGRILSPSTNLVTILDSNSGLHFSSANYLANKTDGVSLITVYRTEYTDTVSSVDFVVTNGTAIAGTNFTATNGTLLFDKGVTAQSFSVQIIPILVVQPDLTVSLQLSNPTNGVIDSPAAAFLTIHDPTGSYVVPAGSQIVSESGPVNGIIDSNETVTVQFAFRVAGGTNVNNLIATLLATNGVVPVGYATTNYGPMVYREHSVSRPYSFMALGTNQQPIYATFQLQDTNSMGVTNLGLATFTYTVGSWMTTFSNTAMIVINDNTNASPYPSVISVTQVGGALIKATVTLNKLTHGSPKDVDALVVSPSGANVLIMAHAGSSGASATNLVLTFDDAAATSLPQTGTLTSGTNKPTQFYPVRGFY